MASQWSPARVDMLRKLAGEQKSASQIAEVMSTKFGTKITRNAIIGQATRHKIMLGEGRGGVARAVIAVAKSALRVAKRGSSPPEKVYSEPALKANILPPSRAPESHLSKEKRLAPRAERNGGVAPSKLIKPAPLKPKSEEISIPASKRIGVMELRESTCKWPIGDPRGTDFGFCGAAKPVDSCCPYCAPHARIAYASIADRRRHDAFVRKGIGGAS